MNHLDPAGCCIQYLFSSYCLFGWFLVLILIFFPDKKVEQTVCIPGFFHFLTHSRICCFQVSARFSKRIQAKIKDLLQQMEEGLKTADPHDCSAYTGWTGEKAWVWMKRVKWSNRVYSQEKVLIFSQGWQKDSDRGICVSWFLLTLNSRSLLSGMTSADEVTGK